MTDKFKDQDSMLPAATSDKKKISAKSVKPAKNGSVIINPPQKTDRDSVTERFVQALRKHSVIIEKKTEMVLQSKAVRADLPEETLKQVFTRGYKTLPLNSELTREQYAMNRVNSFVAGGAAMVEDFDLLPITERTHTRMGVKGTGGAMRPHIKREKSPYNGKTVFHVVDAKGNIKHSSSDEYEAKKHLATKYSSYMGEGTLSPMKRFEGTKSLVKTYKADTPGEDKKVVAEETIHVGHRNSKGDWIKTSTHSNYPDAKKAMADLEQRGKKGVQHRYDNAGSIDPGTHKFRKVDEQCVAEEILSELNKDTLHSYQAKADKQIVAKHRVLGPQIKAGDAKAANKTSATIGKRMAGMDRAVERLNKEEVSICSSCQVDPCICDDSHGFVNEARMSAALRLHAAWEKQRAKSTASLARTPSSIPKKEEPKQEVLKDTLK